MRQQLQGRCGVWMPVWDEAWPVLWDWSQCLCTASEDRTVPAVGPPHPQSLSPASLHCDPPKNQIHLLSFSENWQWQSFPVVMWYVFRLTEDGAQRTAVPPWLKRLLVNSFFARRSNTLTESRVEYTELGPFMTVEAVVEIRCCPRLSTGLHWGGEWEDMSVKVLRGECEGPQQLFQQQNNTPGKGTTAGQTPPLSWGCSTTL